jgi:hypothetical protein
MFSLKGHQARVFAQVKSLEGQEGRLAPASTVKAFQLQSLVKSNG